MFDSDRNCAAGADRLLPMQTADHRLFAAHGKTRLLRVADAAVTVVDPHMGDFGSSVAVGPVTVLRGDA